MNKNEIIIPDGRVVDEYLLHGIKWSEEAKERVRQAHKAGRTVEEMFGNIYKNGSKAVNRQANNIANKTIYKKQVATANRRVQVVKRDNKKMAKDYEKAARRIMTKTPAKDMAKVSRDYQRGRKMIEGVGKDMLKDENNRLKKASNHTTGRIVKDMAKAGAKSAVSNLKNFRKNVDKAITNKANKIVTSKPLSSSEKKELKKQYAKNHKIANKVRDSLAKVNRYGDKQAERIRNRALKNANSKSKQDILNKRKFKNTGDIVKKTVDKGIDKGIDKGVGVVTTYNSVKKTGALVKKTIDSSMDKNATPLSVYKTAKNFNKQMQKISVEDEKKRKQLKAQVKRSLGLKQGVVIPGKTGISDVYLKHGFIK